MNDEHIQQVLNIEKEARRIHDDAVHESEQILLQAEQEAGSMLENAKTGAEKEARRLAAGAEAKEENARILAEAEKNNEHAKALAAGNLERAVRFVLEQITVKD